MRISPLASCLLILVFASSCTMGTPHRDLGLEPPSASLDIMKAQCRHDAIRNCSTAFKARAFRGTVQAYPEPGFVCQEYARKSCDG